MKPFSPDTSPEVQQMMVDRWRSMPSWEKANMVDALCRDSLRLAMAGVQARFPEISPRQARVRIARVQFGAALTRQAFGEAGGE